jgi:hypothetical protein
MKNMEKPKLNSDKIWKIMEEKQVEQWKDMKNMEKPKSNSDKIWTIWKKK